MAKEEFILDVRRALGLLRPAVSIDTPRIESQQVAVLLPRAAIWLTPKTVELFDPADFPDSSNCEALTSAVGEFRELASQIPPDQPVSDDQFENGNRLFRKIVAILKQDVLAEWKDAVGQVISDVESWSSNHRFPCRRDAKRLEEKLLDTYELPQLFIQVDATSFLLSPVARFVPGAIGMIDLSVIPSYHVVMIPRMSEGWSIHIEGNTTLEAVQRLPWEEDAFLQGIEWLRERA